MYTSSLKFAAGNGSGIRERVARLNANGTNLNNNNNIHNHNISAPTINNNGFTTLTVSGPPSYNNYCSSSSIYTKNGSMEPLSLETAMKNPEKMESKCTFIRTNSASQIPLATSRLTGNAISSSGGVDASRWQAKYEEAERRRKSLLGQNQKDARKLVDLEKKYNLLQESYKKLENDYTSSEHNLAKIEKVSQDLYKEYDQLKNKYEVETGAMHKAMKSASQWYNENKALKRRSAVLVQKFLEVSPGGNIDIDDVDTGGTSPNEMEDLTGTVKELSEQIARLQTELNAAKLQEFEAQEAAAHLSTALEVEKDRTQRLEDELMKLRAMQNSLDQVSRMVAVEMTSLRDQCNAEREEATRMRHEATRAQKERNVLAHQSALLMADIIDDDRSMVLLQEIDLLKRQLEDQKAAAELELREMQNKLEEREAEASLELMEEKLKLAEAELECALQRAQRAELESKQLQNQVSQLENELAEKCAPPLPPPPPPLPPPPPPLPSSMSLSTNTMPCTITSIQSTIKKDCVNNPVLDMANMLRGVPKKPKPEAVPGGAIEDIINQIKGGKFMLKATEKQKEEKKQEPAPAVQEMLNILGTLKRRPKTSRPPLDVAL